MLAAALARQLGGGRAAQALAALATIAAPVYLGLSSFYSMNAFEPLLWGGALWLLTRIANGARPSTWIWLGVVLAPEPCSIENSQMTPTMKINRNPI